MMKLKTIDHSQIPKGKLGHGKNSLSVSKGGIFRFNTVAERRMGLKNWPAFDFAKDLETGRWHLIKSQIGFEMDEVKSGKSMVAGMIRKQAAWYMAEQWGFSFEKRSKCIVVEIEDPVEWAGKQYYPLTFISKPEELSKPKTDIYDAN